MKTTEIYLTRLRKLADYLSSGKLKAEVTPAGGICFKHKGNDSEEADVLISYFGWAICELPEIFKEWKYDSNKFPILIEEPNLEIIDSVTKFLGVSDAEYFHILVPFMQKPVRFGGKNLFSDSEPEDIAYNIYELIKRKQNVQ